MAAQSSRKQEIDSTNTATITSDVSRMYLNKNVSNIKTCNFT